MNAPRPRALLGAALAAALCCLPVADAHAQDPAPPGVVAFQSTRCDQGGAPVNYPGPGPQSGWCRPSIFTVRADGSALTRITTGASRDDEGSGKSLSGDFFPSVAPAGDRIVFVRDVGNSDLQLFTMRSDGSDQRRLMPDAPPAAANPGTPAWSPTGESIAFVASAGPRTNPFAINEAVFVLDLATGAVRRLSADGIDATAPVFTPDGSAVAYFATSANGGPEAGLYRTTLDGSRTDQMTLGDLPIARNGMSFSPDGRYAAVTGGDGRLYTISADGRQIVPRTAGIALNPTWSPVGPTLFYVGEGVESRFSAIHRVSLADAAQPVRLTDGLARDEHPWFSLLGGSVAQPPADRVAPGLVVEGDRGIPPPSSSPGAGAPPPDTARLPFLAFDPSGLLRVEASLALRVHGGCRLANGKGRLGRRVPRCRRQRYLRVASAAAWRQRTARLKAGTYEVRFRTRDVRGNVTKHPRRHVVKLARRG